MADNTNETTAESVHSTPATGASNNPRFRSQRLYLKVEQCMKLVNEILADERKTYIPTWLSSDKLEVFRSAVRDTIRQDYHTSIDAWPQRVAHNYLPDAKKAIIETVNTQWQLFAVDGYDDFVASELFFEDFYQT